MQLTKNILLSLIFSLSFFLAIFYLNGSILNTIKPSWFEGDKGIGQIFWWVFFGLFLLSSISSILWLTNPNEANKYWFLKIPALLILPFSIPFLIIDYLESKKDKPLEKVNVYNKNEKIKTDLIILIIVASFNLVIIFIQIGFLPIPIAFSNWFWFLLLIPVGEFMGVIFLILNYFHSRKIFALLSILAWPFGWFYLFFQK